MIKNPQSQAEQQIIDAIHKFEKQLHIKFLLNHDGTKFMHDNGEYLLKIEVVPTKWIGLDFVIPKARLAYPINTDLYDLQDPQNQTFVANIKTDILHFLDSLLNEKILVTRKSGRLHVLIPISHNKYILLKQGLFLCSAKEITSTTATSLRTSHKWGKLTP